MADLDLEFRVTADAARGVSFFRDLQKREMPFATATSLTFVARKATEHVASELGRHFTLRSRRVRRGIRYAPAQKRDWPRPKARVGSVDDFMAIHATGGIRRPRGRALLIPTRAVKRTKTGKVFPSQSPARLSARGESYVEGGALWKRGRGRRGRSRMLFFLRPQARIDKRWPLAEDVAHVVNRRFGPYFRRALADGVRDAIRRAGARGGR